MFSPSLPQHHQVTMPPGKIASNEVMQDVFLRAMRETFGKGSQLVAAMRVETHFESGLPVADMVSCNAVRLLLCCEGDGSKCSFTTSALSGRVKGSRTWFAPFHWKTPDELRKNFNSKDKLSLLNADDTGEDVYYIIFYDEDGGVQKEGLVDEAVKRLAREVFSPEYRTHFNINDKAHSKKSASPDFVKKAFAHHMREEMLPYFRRLLMKEKKNVECDVLDPRDVEAVEAGLDQRSADIYVAYEEDRRLSVEADV